MALRAETVVVTETRNLALHADLGPWLVSFCPLVRESHQSFFVDIAPCREGILRLMNQSQSSGLQFAEREAAALGDLPGARGPRRRGAFQRIEVPCRARVKLSFFHHYCVQ